MLPNSSTRVRVILDYDGTLTREELQADLLRDRSLGYLAGDVLGVSRQMLEREYEEVRRRLLAHPERYGWIVYGQMAAYCDEGAFILNTTTLQQLLTSTPAYRGAVERHFPDERYEPVMNCVNFLFHRFTSDLPPFFREDCHRTLSRLLDLDGVEPVVLTNSKGDKVRWALTALGMPLLPADSHAHRRRAIRILGDVRQYDMSTVWPPGGGEQVAEFLRVDKKRRVDLRRPVYYRTLMRERESVDNLVVVADGFSLAGGLSLALGIPFFLVKAPYTPAWVIRFVESHPLGTVLDSLSEVLLHVESGI